MCQVGCAVKNFVIFIPACLSRSLQLDYLGAHSRERVSFGRSIPRDRVLSNAVRRVPLAIPVRPLATYLPDSLSIRLYSRLSYPPSLD